MTNERAHEEDSSALLFVSSSVAAVATAAAVAAPLQVCFPVVYAGVCVGLGTYVDKLTRC